MASSTYLATVNPMPTDDLCQRVVAGQNDLHAPAMACTICLDLRSAGRRKPRWLGCGNLRSAFLSFEVLEPHSGGPESIEGLVRGRPLRAYLAGSDSPNCNRVVTQI